MKRLVKFIKTKDNEIEILEHGKRVKNLATQLACISGNESNISNLQLAAEYHDVGKLRIPEKILYKPAKLTDYEFFVMQTHPMHSYRMLKNLYVTENVATLALYHHENYDGTGYNYKLQGEEIPLGARIIRICDTWDALTSDRPYRKKLSHQEAIQIMDSEESKFDPELYKNFKEFVLKLSTNKKGRKII